MTIVSSHSPFSGSRVNYPLCHCAGGQARAPTENLSPPKTDTLPDTQARRAGAGAEDGRCEHREHRTPGHRGPGETMLTLEHYTDIAHCNG